MNVPKLRFDDFSEEWNSYLLNEVTEYVDYRGKTPTKTNQGIPLITAKNIKKGFLDYNISKEYISEGSYQDVMSRGIPAIGDVLLTTEAPLGNVAQIDNSKVALAQRVIKFRGTKDCLLNDFLKYLMLSPMFQHLLVSKAIGTTVLGIQGKVLHKLPINIPSLQEQKKISDLLNSINSKILLQQEKINLVKEQKKGYMQKLFQQEIRFKDDNGGEYSEWDFIKLGKLTKKTGSKNKKGIKYPVASISNKRGFTLEGERNNSNTDVNIKTYKLVYRDEFAYNPSRINVGSFGFQNVADVAIVSSLYVIFKTIDSLSNAYLKAYMHSNFFNQDVLRNTEGSVREYLFYENFSNIKIPLPCLEEQEKIANFLLEIEEKIQVEQQKLELLQEQKKGFMQQMFI
ncbi:restriction endonuclease subunit S [Bacillus cereus]|uniref:restriction endonuclease subunit S n=1 Tax=Bacillus cereus TaxID=1396 RepID=UPI000B4B68CC|nr:restriction endonuclease subunit S [Bacillus cereus]